MVDAAARDVMLAVADFLESVANRRRPSPGEDRTPVMTVKDFRDLAELIRRRDRKSVV